MATALTPQQLHELMLIKLALLGGNAVTNGPERAQNQFAQTALATSGLPDRAMDQFTNTALNIGNLSDIRAVPRRMEDQYAMTSLASGNVRDILSSLLFGNKNAFSELNSVPSISVSPLQSVPSEEQYQSVARDPRFSDLVQALPVPSGGEVPGPISVSPLQPVPSEEQYQSVARDPRFSDLVPPSNIPTEITNMSGGGIEIMGGLNPRNVGNAAAIEAMRQHIPRAMIVQAEETPQDRPVNIPPPVMRGEGPALGVMSAPAREIDLGPAFSGVQAGGGGGGNGIQGLLTELVQYAMSPQGKVRESDEYTTGPAHVDPALIGQIMSLAAGQQGIAQGRAETESAQIANEQMRRLSEIAQGSGAMDQGDLARASLLMGKWPYPWPDSSDQEFKSQLAQQEMSGNRGEALLDFASNQLSMATDEEERAIYLNMMKRALGMMGINYDEMLLDAQKFLEEQGKAGKS